LNNPSPFNVQYLIFFKKNLKENKKEKKERKEKKNVARVAQ
jgi:hypothetical protein